MLVEDLPLHLVAVVMSLTTLLFNLHVIYNFNITSARQNLLAMCNESNLYRSSSFLTCLKIYINVSNVSQISFFLLSCRGEGVVVYNCCTGQQNPITWSRFVKTSFKYMRKHPFS